MQARHRLKVFCQKAFTPITIMFIPHDNPGRSLNLNVPVIGVLLTAVCSLVGAAYLVFAVPDMVRLHTMEKQLLDYSRKAYDFNATLLSLKSMEGELRQLISLGSKEKILEKVDTSDVGSFDISQVQEQIETSIRTIGAIRDYLRSEKNLYLATPRGLPVAGTISSPYGSRINPISGQDEFHRGLDISAEAGTPVAATADGVVVFSGHNPGGGNIVVIAHGHNFSTYYAHNRLNAVRVGDRVSRGSTIAYVGSTGSATGSHVHYEVWRKGRSENPNPYTKRRS